MLTLRARRKLLDHAMTAFATLMAALCLALLAWILWTLLYRGFAGLNPSVFLLPMSPTGEPGGLSNAIVGSLIQVALGIAIAIPIGIMAGTFLAEYARGSRFGDVVRFINDVLLSAPSILVGLFVYAILVVPFGGFSAIAGVVALAIIAIPVIVRATEDMLNLVPLSLREAALALGAPKWKVVTFVCWRAARAGIVTGMLLALARISGETAPLLFTSLGNTQWSLDLTEPMASLPVVINKYAGSPYDDWRDLAWAGALIITLGVLTLNILARVATRKRG